MASENSDRFGFNKKQETKEEKIERYGRYILLGLSLIGSAITIAAGIRDLTKD